MVKIPLKNSCIRTWPVSPLNSWCYSHSSQPFKHSSKFVDNFLVILRTYKQTENTHKQKHNLLDSRWSNKPSWEGNDCRWSTDTQMYCRAYCSSWGENCWALFVYKRALHGRNFSGSMGRLGPNDYNVPCQNTSAHCMVDSTGCAQPSSFCCDSNCASSRPTLVYVFVAEDATVCLIDVHQALTTVR